MKLLDKIKELVKDGFIFSMQNNEGKIQISVRKRIDEGKVIIGEKVEFDADIKETDFKFSEGIQKMISNILKREELELKKT